MLIMKDVILLTVSDCSYTYEGRMEGRAVGWRRPEFRTKQVCSPTNLSNFFTNVS